MSEAPAVELRKPNKASSLEEMMGRERERLQKAHEEATDRKNEAEAEMESIERELAAIEAYERVKRGELSTAPIQPKRERKPRSAPSGPRAPRGAIRAEIISIIRDRGSVTRSELIEVKDVKGNKAGEQSISNALTNMVKANQLVRDNSGHYQLPSGASDTHP